MSEIVAPGVPVRGDTEVRNFVCDFTDMLDSGELLTGTPTVVELVTSALTLASEALNSSELTVNGRTVAANSAVQWKASGGSANTVYTVLVTATTNATPAQTLQQQCRHRVVDDGGT